MSFFDSEKSLFHLVFANPGDVYTTGELLPLEGTERFLEYTLRKSGYVNFIRWEYEGGADTFSFIGEPRESGKELLKRNKFLSFAKKSSDVQKIASSGQKETIDLLQKFVSCSDKTAVIVKIGDLCAGLKAEQINELRRRLPAASKSIIIVTATGCAEDSASFLIDPNSAASAAFRLPELGVQANAETDLFTFIHEKLGEKAVFLNNPNEEEIRNIALRSFMFRDSASLLLKNVDVLAAFVYHYFNSTVMRHTFELPISGERPVSLRNELSQNVFSSETLCGFILNWLGSNYSEIKSLSELRFVMSKEHPADTFTCPLYVSDPVMFSLWSSARSKIRYNTNDITAKVNTINRMVSAISSYGLSSTQKNDLFRTVCNENVFMNDFSTAGETTKLVLDATISMLRNYFCDDSELDSYCTIVSSNAKIINEKLRYLKESESDINEAAAKLGILKEEMPFWSEESKRFVHYEFIQKSKFINIDSGMKLRIQVYEQTMMAINSCYEYADKFSIAMKLGNLKTNDMVKADLNNIVGRISSYCSNIEQLESAAFSANQHSLYSGDSSTVPIKQEAPAPKMMPTTTNIFDDFML